MPYIHVIGNRVYKYKEDAAFLKEYLPFPTEDVLDMTTGIDLSSKMNETSNWAEVDVRSFRYNGEPPKINDLIRFRNDVNRCGYHKIMYIWVHHTLSYEQVALDKHRDDTYSVKIFGEKCVR